MKLLAIDDNQDNLTSLQAVVHDVLPECTVITARSGQQGLKLAAAEDPDVILLDIVMPEMDGFEVCRRLKADPDLRSIPVVFLTALRTDRESQARALAAGGDAFLTKPLNEQELIAQIRAMVRLKMAARFQMLDKEQLSTLVAERTMALEHELIERRQAQQAAEQAAQEWQATFDASNDAIWILDASQRVLRANKTSEKFFSRPCSSILGQQCWSVVHGANAPHSDCPLVRAHRTGHRETLEFQDGNRWLEVKVDPIMLADGHYHGAVHTVSDITEHRQAVEKLRENEHFLREVQEIASMGSYVLDIADGRWKSSEVLDRVLGLGPSYVRSVEGWVRLIHPDERATMAAYFREHVLGRKQLFVKEYRIIRQNDGAVRWVYGRGKLEFDPQGCPVKMKGTIHDITERKLEADALQQSEERYRLIFNASGDAMVSCALSEDGQPHTFIMVNDVACERYGYARAELLRMTPLELDAPEGRKVATAAIKKLMAEKQATWESWHQTKDGRQIPVEIVAVLFSLRGERMIFAVVRDITARKQGEAERNALQAQLAQAQKMESIGRLAGGVAHDFNNMLQVILGNADLCMMKVSPESPLHKWLRAINKSALHAKSLTRQLLAFSRREIIEPARVDLNRIVVEMMKLLPRLIGENIAIVWRPDPEPGFVKADSSPIDQILTNLAINARDAIRGTGTITIKTSHVTLHHADCRQHPGATPGDYVVLTFADTGCGMDQEIRAHIFEPFFTTKAAGKGTGLGLAMVYGIVSQNNGFIDVASAPGQGTSFNIYWPRVRGAGTHQVAGETPQAVVGGSETILLVEDEEVVRALTYEFLASLGYTVLTADGPETALRLAAGPSGEIQLLVTDVIMPVMNGRDLARRVVELRPAIKSLFVSGFAADALAQQGGVLDAGVHFLAKPFSRDDLARKVREALTA